MGWSPNVKLRLYLDTSVFNLRFDLRSPDRHKLTCEFFDRVKEFELSSSEVARMEISRAADAQHRGQMLQLLDGMLVHQVSKEMTELAAAYINAGVFTPAMDMDALHVAVAVVTGKEIVVSWNFKHLVNRRRRGLINLTNLSLGLPTIEILAPPEI